MEIKIVLKNHKKWLSDIGGERANLRYADLRSANLRYANLRSANLRDANLSDANLRYADLSYANLSYADLSYANLSDANLSYATLSSANLSSANLRYTNLSGVTGLISPIVWMTKNLEKTKDGYIAYKSFNSNYHPPKSWVINEGQEIADVVNPLPTLECACGVNVSTKNWVSLPRVGIWKVLIKWEWLPSVVIPYNTNGRFRCERILLLERIDRDKTKRDSKGRFCK